MVKGLRSEFVWELRECTAFLQKEFENPELTESMFNEVLANDKLLYAGFPNIGSDGLLFERRTRKIWLIPGAVGRDVYLWAYVRGFRIDEDNQLVILSMRDREETLKALMHGLHARFVRNEIEPKLEPPVALRLSWDSLWMMVSSLRKIDVAGEPFCFEVNPANLPANQVDATS